MTEEQRQLQQQVVRLTGIIEDLVHCLRRREDGGARAAPEDHPATGMVDGASP